VVSRGSAPARCWWNCCQSHQARLHELGSSSKCRRCTGWAFPPSCLSQAFTRFITPPPVKSVSRPLRHRSGGTHTPLCGCSGRPRGFSPPRRFTPLDRSEDIAPRYRAGVHYVLRTPACDFSSVSEAPVLSPGGPAPACPRLVARHPSKSLLAGSRSASLRPVPSCRFRNPDRSPLQAVAPCPSPHRSELDSAESRDTLRISSAYTPLRGTLRLQHRSTAVRTGAALLRGCWSPWSRSHTAEAAG
jgi:hypothetical protein